MNKLQLIRKAMSPAVSQKMGRLVLAGKVNSPHILFGAGVVGFAATTVLASRATLRVDEVLQKTQQDLQNVRTVEQDSEMVAKHHYTEEDALRDRIYIYTRTFVDVGRLYAPTILVGTLTVAAFARAHFILNTRVAALTVAYNGLDRAFKLYRDRVRQEFGEEVERDLRYDAYSERVAIENKDTGSKEVVERKRIGETAYSPYARFFDEYNQHWQDVPHANYLFLRAQQNYANDLLKAKGHVFLNEVYDMLGMERSKAGQVVGWRINEDGTGDNYIDFGFLHGDDPRLRDFVNGRELSVFLDFNVDGVIVDRVNFREV
jgi:hypothetical protein